MRRIVTLLLIAVVLLPAAAMACLWDFDTLEMERKQFPQIVELITGKFLRHSKAFYEWRIENRLARIEESPEDVLLYDDLAVAYDKTGRHDIAIETILKARDLQPDRYETLANLGTFHIHNGDLETGLEFIGQAIEINPDAHFGREIYQQLLVEYVLEKRVDGVLPQPLSSEEAMIGRRGFARFVLLRQEGDEKAVDQSGQIEKAVKGISGMMRFGHHDSPVLLEALADLLMAQSGHEARRLATRAWLKASYEIPDEEAAARYRKAADQVLSLQTPGRRQHTRIPLDEFEKKFRAELADAEKWFAGVSADEARWISAGADVDEEFRRKYYETPAIARRPESDSSTALPGSENWFWKTGRFLLPGLVLLAIPVVWLRKRRLQALDGE